MLNRLNSGDVGGGGGGSASSRGEVNLSVKYRISGRISLAAHSTGIRIYSSQTGMSVKDVVVLSLMARVCMRFFNSEKQKRRKEYPLRMCSTKANRFVIFALLLIVFK
jgi:hypothetical protein